MNYLPRSTALFPTKINRQIAIFSVFFLFSLSFFWFHFVLFHVFALMGTNKGTLVACLNGSILFFSQWTSFMIHWTRRCSILLFAKITGNDKYKKKLISLKLQEIKSKKKWKSEKMKRWKGEKVKRLKGRKEKDEKKTIVIWNVKISMVMSIIIAKWLVLGILQYIAQRNCFGINANKV